MWEDVVYVLRELRLFNIKGMYEKVFFCFKLSFDQVQNEEFKLCYLYCFLFFEDYDVQVEYFLRYGIGEGLFYDVEIVDEVRNRVYFIIIYFKAFCFFLSSKKEDCIKMYDVFRDLVILIVINNDYSFMVKVSLGLKGWLIKLKLEYVMRMSLINNEFSIFSDQREYLEFLLLLL